MNRRNEPRWLGGMRWLAGIGLAVTLGCDPGDGDPGSSGADEGQGGQACVPGHSLACTCTDGSAGAQICDVDGSYGVCSCDGSADGGSDGGADTGGDGSDSGGTGDPAVPSWTIDVVPFIYERCGPGVAGCHDREMYAATFDQDCRGWLSLEDLPLGSVFYGGDNAGQPTGCPDTPLYERLVGLAPWQCEPEARYVIPGDPDGSYVVRKILGTNMCGAPGEFESMPPPASAIEVSPEELAMLRAWIAAGAPFDG